MIIIYYPTKKFYVIIVKGFMMNVFIEILRIKKFYNKVIIRLFINKKLRDPFINLSNMFFDEEIELRKHKKRKKKISKRKKKEKLEQLKKRLDDEDEEE